MRAAAKALVPASLRDALRTAALRPYDLTLVTKRQSAFAYWFSKHVLRLYYPPSVVSRETALQRWSAVHVRHEKPTLFHFDVHITDHCNLNCKGCGHFSNLCKPNYLDLEAFVSDVEAIAEKLHMEQIYLLGGEPLLHPRVAEFIREARRILPDTRIYVVTNGSIVMRQDDEFWHAMAETKTILMCDAYPIGLPVDEIDAKAADSGVAVEWTDERSLFFKVPIDIEGRQDAADSYRRCSGINNCPMYKDGRLYPCAYTSYIEVFKERFEITDALEVTEADSIAVREHTGEELMRFMTRPVPFCRHCDFDRFVMYEWGRTERTIEEWT